MNPLTFEEARLRDHCIDLAAACGGAEFDWSLTELVTDVANDQYDQSVVDRVVDALLEEPHAGWKK